MNGAFASYLQEEGESEYVGGGVEESGPGGVGGHPVEVRLEQKLHLGPENKIMISYIIVQIQMNGLPVQGDKSHCAEPPV